MSEVATTVDELFRQYQVDRDPAIREELILAHMQLVRYNAGRMIGRLHSSVELQDLISYGTFGLMDAVERFDPERGVPFGAFASWRIQGAMNDEMRSLAWEPRSVRAAHRRAMVAMSELEHELGRAPSDEEIATRVGVEVPELRRVLAEVQTTRMASLDTPVTAPEFGGGFTLGDTVASVSGSEVELTPQVSEMSHMLAEAIERLPANERLLIQLLYAKRMMLKEVAEVLQVTDSWVCHLHTRAVVNLQRMMAGLS